MSMSLDCQKRSNEIQSPTSFKREQRVKHSLPRSRPKNEIASTDRYDLVSGMIRTHSVDKIYFFAFYIFSVSFLSEMLTNSIASSAWYEIILRSLLK